MNHDHRDEPLSHLSHRTHGPHGPHVHLDPLALLDMSLGTDQSPDLGACPRCQDELRDTREAMLLLALALPPVTPSPSLRVRLLAAVAPPLTAHAPALAAIYDRPESELHALLARVVDDADAWTQLLPGIEHHLIDTRAGPIGGLLRITPGVHFPHHLHHGDEHMRVLQGSCVDSNGVLLGPGDELHSSPGTAHALLGHPGAPLVIAYLSGLTEFTGVVD